MISLRAFKQVDVFTSVPLLGNPVAVILDGDGLSTAQMQQVAHWTNVSETTFVLPPTDEAADYQLRIFTPRTELPFAGHPTLGSAYALVEAGLITPRGGRVVQQCTVGLVTVTIGEDQLSFELPSFAFEDAPSPEILVAALGGADAVLDAPVIVNVGPRWVIAQLASAAVIETLSPDLSALADYDHAHKTTGLTVFALGGAGDITVRSFAPADGIAEDPVCGSGNAAVAAYRLRAGQITGDDQYRASQGRQVRRDGHVFAQTRGGTIHIGGACVTCIDGFFHL
jgi:PhzF family phenazine biosynthesis protein